MRRYGEALADLDRAIGLDPSKDWAIASRGETYLAMRRYGEALGHWPRRSARVERRNPNDDLGWFRFFDEAELSF